MPKVVLLDIDGTLVGRVSSAACEIELLRSTGGATGPRLRAARADLIARLRYGIIRPHVDAFCRQAAASRDVELFIYTASEDRWAAHLVPCIEAALGVRFNRPILSRKNCVRGCAGSPAEGCQKSISKVLPLLAKALRKKYPSVRGPEDLRNRVVLVDNTHNVLADPHERARLIVCPTYNYNYTFDVLSHLDVNALHRSHGKIAPILSSYGLLPSGAGARALHPNYQHLAQAYYSALGRAIAESMPANVAALRGDSFFAALASALLRPGSGGWTDDEVRAVVRRVVSAAHHR